MKNKTIVILITVISIFLIGLLNIRYNFIGNISKLKADISYPSEPGLRLICDDSTLKVGDDTTCVITGYYEGGMQSLTAGIETSSGLQFKNITPYSGMVKSSGSGNKFIIQTESGDPTSNKFIVATTEVTATAVGTNTVSVVGNTDEHPELGDKDFNPVYVDDAVFTITVTNASEPETPKSSDTSLKSVTVNGGAVTLNDNMIYTVPYNVSQAVISATTNDSKAAVDGDLGTKTLSVGNNVYTIRVTAEDNTKKTYTLTITRQNDSRSSINTLSSLSIAPATLTPEFKSDITEYSSTVLNDVTSVTIAATLTDTKATITSSSSTGEKSLTVGNNKFTITVKAENGEEKVYNINIVRQAVIDSTKSNDNTLEYITVDGNKYTNFDDINYETTKSEIEIIAKTNDENAEIDTEVSSVGTVKLNTGINTLKVQVTAENGEVKVYTFTVKLLETTAPKCELILKSNVYKVDNQNSIVDAVSKNHSDETIKKNLSSDCGEITVANEKVTLTTKENVKIYTINRVWQAQTGQIVIKYTAIILSILAIIGILIFVKIKISKK